MSNKGWGQFKKESSNTWTDPLTVVYGSYKWLNDSPIHYFLTSLSLKNLWDDVRLMNEIPGVEKWGFEALFQRVVRPEWVRQMKAQYLASKERFKFFPPVTIALLPCRDDVPQRVYEGEGKFHYEVSESRGVQASLPGLDIHFPTEDGKEFPEFGKPAIIKWNKRKYSALAIDGQHRISALRAFVPQTSQETQTKDIPAVILVFDPQLPHGRDLIQATREIFIDINKNAKTVDDSRLILLDDRNFYNGLTRRTILQAYPNGEDPSEVVYDSIEEDIGLTIPKGIPQELVDSAMGRDAADVNKLKPWQFTSAFILKRAIHYFFFEDSFARFEEMLETSGFQTDAEDDFEAEIAGRREEYEDENLDEDEHIADQDMLSFRPAITEKLVDRAMRMHRSLLLGVFTAFRPYKEHIDRFAKVSKSDDAADIRSLMLSEGSIPGGAVGYETKVAQELKEDPARFKKLRKAIEGLSKPVGWDANLVWYSIFQRGLVYQPMLIRRAMDNASAVPLVSREAFADAYVNALDLIFDEGWFSKDKELNGKSVWGGVALKIGDAGEPAMDGSDGGAKRVGALIRLMASAICARETDGYSYLKAKFNTNGLKGAKTAVEKGYVRYMKAKDSAAGKLKDDAEYKLAAEKLLESILKEIADADKI